MKGDVQQLAAALSDSSHKTLLTQLVALLGVCQTRLLHTSKPQLSRSAMTAWDWQLQESGIFEEDHAMDDVKDHSDVIQVPVPVREETPAKVWTNREQAVQTVTHDVHEKSMQTHQPGSTPSASIQDRRELIPIRL